MESQRLRQARVDAVWLGLAGAGSEIDRIINQRINL
jgi:hypothetical protein